MLTAKLFVWFIANVNSDKITQQCYPNNRSKNRMELTFRTGFTFLEIYFVSKKSSACVLLNILLKWL